MALWWTRISSAGTRVLSLSLGCFESAGRQCYSVVTAVPSLLPQRVTLVAREHRAAPPPLPAPKYLDMKDHCRLEYVDVRSPEITQSTLVLIHGAPGSYRDFRNLIPLLAQQPGLRIIGINLPGYGGSVVEKARYLETVSATRTAEVALDAIRHICEDSGDVFLLGHSFGAHTVINMAALNATESTSAAKEALAIRGLALIAPAGCVPHQSLHMGAISLTVKLLQSGNSWAVSAATHFTKFVYTKLLRFPSGDSSTDPFVSAVAKLLGSLRLPTFITWTKDDEHIQPEIPSELCKLFPVGPRLEFSGGGHNLQKTRADQIATAITKWIHDILAKTEG